MPRLRHMRCQLAWASCPASSLLSGPGTSTTINQFGQYPFLPAPRFPARRYLDPDYRRPLVLAEVLGFQADIMCLQARQPWAARGCALRSGTAALARASEHACPACRPAWPAATKERACLPDRCCRRWMRRRSAPTWSRS